MADIVERLLGAQRTLVGVVTFSYDEWQAEITNFDRLAALLREQIAAGIECAKAVDALDAVLLEEDNCDNCDPGGKPCTVHDRMEGRAWSELRQSTKRHAAAVKACEEVERE